MTSDIAEDVKSLDDYWNNGDYIKLRKASRSIIDQNPDQIESKSKALRYLGLVNTIDGNSPLGMAQLKKASLLNDEDAQGYLNIFHEFIASRVDNIDISEVVLQLELLKLRKTQYMDYPKEIHIETQAICNAACSFCPYPTMDRKGDKMSDQLIEKILSDLTEIPPNLPFTIAPFKVSDPFLDKRIFKISHDINSALPNASLRFFTNGSALTNANIEKLAEIKNVSHLWISLNESEEKAYEKLMVIPFSRTIGRLDSLHTIAMEGYPHEICVSRVADGTDRDRAFQEFVTQNYPLFQCIITKRSDWLGQVTIDGVQTVPNTACERWYEISVMASGKVALCCMDGEGKYIIGDLNNQSVLEIYNQPGYKKMRQFLFSRAGAASPCDTCTL